MKVNNDDELVQRNYPVQENMRWIKMAWISERIGYLFLAAFILFALFGGLSQGVLSDRLYHNQQENITVRYERLLRNSTESDIFIMFPTRVGEQHVVTLKGNFIKDYDIEYISPDNIRMVTNPQGIALHPPQEEAAGLSSVKMTFKPNESGSYHLNVLLDGRDIMLINQYVFP
jgi:hypothetical protein